MEEYKKGQEDLINYIKAQVNLILKTSKGQDQVLDLINLLKELRPLNKN